MSKDTTTSSSSPSTTTNTAIRIPTDVYEKIEMQALTEDKTVSAIINNILRKYVTWDQFISDIGFVFLQKPFVRNIFENISEEDIVKAAKTTCYIGMKDAISFIHGKNDIESIVDVIKLWLSASNFPNKIIKDENKIEIRIQHHLGRKCSIYMGTLLSLLFADLNIKLEKSTLSDHSLIVAFKLSKNKHIQ